MGVNILYSKEGKIGSKLPRTHDIYQRLLLVKLYSFLARQTKFTFNQVWLKRLYMSHTNQLTLSLFLMMRKMKLPGQEDKTAMVVRTIKMMCVSRRWKEGVCAAEWAATPRITPSRWGARSSPPRSSPGPEFPQELRQCSAVRARAERCTGFSAKSRESHRATPNPTDAAKTRSSIVAETEVPAAATKTNPRFCLVIKGFGYKNEWIN